MEKFSETDIKFMSLAIDEAKTAYGEFEVPVGCVLVKDGEILAKTHNFKEQSQNPLGHAELLAISAASEALGTWRLDGVDCYVTVEPCHMCASALQQARVQSIFYAAPEPKTGALESIDTFFSSKHLNHQVKVVPGLLEKESITLLKTFFQNRRKDSKTCKHHYQTNCRTSK